MKTLVTGAAGFIGSTLSGRLIDDGAAVIGVDSFTDYYDPKIKRRNLDSLTGSNSFSLVEADLAEADLDSLLRDVEVIFHQAGQPGVRKSWGADFTAYTHANVAVTQRLLEAARRAPRLERFVYASSSSVYGNAETFPTTETDLPQPISPYGVTKLAAEHLCSLYAEEFGVPTVSLRYFTVYGPRQRPDMAFNKFITAALSGAPVQVYGDGHQIREFTYVDDIVDANLKASGTQSPRGSVVNLSGGSSVSVNEVLEIIREMNQGELTVEHTKRADGDVLRTGGSTARAREILGWSPSTRLEEGLSAEFEWIARMRREARDQ